MNNSVRPDEYSDQRADAAEDLLRVAVEEAGSDAVLVRVAGDIDLTTAAVLRERLCPRLERPGTTVVLDLTGVSFLGSAGLSELVTASDLASTNGVSLLLVAANRAVLRPLEITGLLPLFTVFDSVEAALDQV